MKTHVNSDNKIIQNNFTLHIPNKFPRLIILLGTNFYLLNKFQKQITNTWLSNLDDNEISSAKQVIELATIECWRDLFQSSKCFSLLTSKPIFIAKSKNSNIETNIQNIIKDYLIDTQNDNDEKLILIIAPELNIRSTFFLNDLPNCSVIDIKTPDEKIINEWVSYQLNKKNFKFDKKYLDLIYQQTEGNLTATAQGLTKLMLCYPKGTSLTDNIILDHFDQQAMHQNFELTKQILNGNQEKALAILRYILQDPHEFHLVLWQIAQILRNVYEIKFHMKIKNVNFVSAARSLKIWSSQHVGYQKLSNKLDHVQIVKLIKNCQEIDVSSKTNAPYLANKQLEICVMQICKLLNSNHE